MDADDISKLVELADSLVYQKTGQHLETVEQDILRQTLQGKKLTSIHFPSYENSYVQRFRAPKLWDLLSVVTGEKVRKKTVLEVLQRLKKQQLQSGATTQRQSSANAQAELNCTNCQNLNHLNFCQACSNRLLLNGQLREPFAANHPQTKKVSNWAYDFTAQEFQSSSQSNPDNSEPNFDRTYGLPTFMKFMKPGVPLLLSLGILSSGFALSWLANWYGVTNHQIGQLPVAQLGYSLALKLNPLSAAAHYNQGATYEDQQNYEMAHAEYQLAIKGGLSEAYNNQARLYILEGNYDAAVSLLRIGLGLAKDDRVRADMYKNQGWARLEQGRHHEAKLDLEEAIKLKSDRAPAYCLLAQVLEHEGNKKDAKVQWENCLGFAYQPNTPELDKWVNLARQRLDAKGGEK